MCIRDRDSDEDVNQEEVEDIETSSEDLPGSESDEESIQDQKEDVYKRQIYSFITKIVFE